MKELVVVSGKGGTGKTSLAASLAILSDQIVVVDCDVDAPDLHLLLEPQTINQEPFVGGYKAHIDHWACQGCGRCAELCRFDAISRGEVEKDLMKRGFVVDTLACEGCGVCADHCPQKAIELRPHVNGRWFMSRFRRGYLFHASLDVGSENSGKLVTQLRRAACEFAKREGFTMLLTDGPPGIGCPVIASLTGASLALIVTEPTVSGWHDFERIARLCLQLGVPAVTVINKADLNPEMVDQIAQHAAQYAAECVATIPFDPDVLEAQMKGRSVVEISNGSASQAIKATYSAVMSRLGQAPAVHHGEIVPISLNQTRES